MTVVPMRSSQARHPGPPFLWDRQLRPAIDSMVAHPASPPRALVVGNAGSGKSSTLRHLHEVLRELERPVHVAHAGAVTGTQVPRGDVLLIDDAHLLDDALLESVQARAADPGAGLIVSIRPWPWSNRIRAIARMLERTAAPIVLGHVGRPDVLRHLEAQGRSLPEHCLRDILDATGGLSWLVAEALRQHDERDCAAGRAHGELQRALEERVSHRLDLVDPDLRRAIEKVSVVPAGGAMVLSDVAEDVVAQGHAEGLLLRNGSPVPIVRTTVRATVSARRLAELSEAIAGGLAHSAAEGDGTLDWGALLGSTAVGTALMEHADRMLDTRPARAAELYRAAAGSGVDPAVLAVREAEAAWASGDLDAAGTIAEDAPPHSRTVDGDRLANVAAGVWAARGMMAQADAVYRAFPPAAGEASALAAIAAIGNGSIPGIDADADGRAAPSTLRVAMDLTRRGLIGSITGGDPAVALADLVRAAEMYTSARSSRPVPELPAVIATAVSLNLGAMLTAQTVVDDAIRGGHGGLWARPRLLLWRAWVAVQRARPADAREALARAHALAPSMSARDALLARAVEVAIARRYEDASRLEEAWRHARAALLRTDIDLYLLHPLAELVSSAPRVGDTARVQPHLLRALEITSGLGDPSQWIAHLRWAGIQQGILLGQPAQLAPHAKALVAASADNHVAAVMARAGRVWTSVLGGSVDAPAVETAAEGLASIGLKWDGARLAGHGAGRTSDRRIAARLLACARELHPSDGTRKLMTTDADSAAGSTRTAPEEILSEREIEVARLVLQGKTYAEIGEAIFISPRTAEHHIAHIRHRLGATSRSEVIAKLRQLIGEDASGATSDHGRERATEGPPSRSSRVSG